MDYEKLSDAELDKLVAQKMKSQRSEPNYESMSDEELDKLVAEKMGATEEGPGFLKRLGQSSINALPMAGGVLGGGLGFVSPIPGGAMAGAAGGAAAGTTIKNFLNTLIESEDAPKSRAELYSEPIKEAALAAAGEGAGQLVAQGLAKGGRAIVGAPAKARDALLAKMGSPKAEALEVVDDAGGLLRSQMFEQTPKASAEEITAAAQRIGAKPTAGMLTSNKNVQNLENALSQNPTLAGEVVRKQYEPIYKSIQEGSEGLVREATPSTAYEVGEQVKKGITSRIGEKLDPLVTSYDNILESTSKASLDPKMLNRAADRMMKLDSAEFANLPQGQVVKTFSENLRNAKTADSVKQLLSTAKGQLRAERDPQTRRALTQVVGSLERVQRRGVMQAASEAMTPLQAKKAATDLIKQIKDTNKGYRALMTEIEEIAGPAKINGARSPKDFLDLVEEIPSEQIGQRLFNTKNFDGLMAIKKNLPEEFEVMRRARLSEIADKSMLRGELNPSKLLTQLKGMGPEAREIVLGKGANQLIKDLETVVNSMPAKIGGSDTPRGLAWMRNLFTSQQGAQEVADALKLWQLRGQSVKRAQKPAKGLLKTGRAAGLIGQAGARGLLQSEDEE